MKIARLICLAGAVVICGAMLITFRAAAQNAAPPNTAAAKELVAESFALQEALKKATAALESAQLSLSKGVATPKLVEGVQAELERTQAQHQAIADKLKALNNIAWQNSSVVNGVEYTTEMREETYRIQKPVNKPDGTTEFVEEQVTRQVPVQVPVTKPRTAGAKPSTVIGPGPAKTPAVLAYARSAANESAPDEESQKLFEEEKAAASDASKLSAQLKVAKSEQPRAELRAKLRAKLAEIFDLQQKRRTHEVGLVEERLEKLKETMQKRTAAKDSIIDRRLELVTGGVDELGWEETTSAPVATMNTTYGAISPGAIYYPQPVGVPPTRATANPLSVPAAGATVPAPPARVPAGTFGLIPTTPVPPATPAPAAASAPAAAPEPAAAPIAPLAPAPPPAPDRQR